eukprot:CAMPEP_0113557190 /NCGR_PEP_ID=MMETSP0015_2-20120614/17654_1 /TAXON_ID=2838 /ORGANISM="Odontella" /LENGTH=236 /DNA_ID=CAMNT_0000458589 /DNA_START=37 /DNA_END=744 /DNA_ORIENTATION=- /assembly_acc=CAM_ASM_000160
MSDRQRSRSRSPDRGGAPQDSNGGGGGGGGGGGADEEVKLYVGNLSYDTNDDSLRSAFGRFGSVTDAFLPTDRETGRPRGFGFVTLSTRPSAERAISEMDGVELDGRTVRVNESRPKGDRGGGGGFGGGGGGGFNASGGADVKLYVGGLNYDTDETALRNLFEQHGPVSDCFLPTDRETGKARGFAFVTMTSADAEKAMGACDGIELDGRNLRVNESRPKRDSGGGGGGGYGGGGG